jgi:Spy/CpxP family protein refolding chaperone
MKKWIIGAVALLVVFGVLVGTGCTYLQAAKGPFDGDTVNQAFVEHVVDKVGHRLDLTPYQTARFRETVTAMLTKALARREETRAVREALAGELGKDQLDRKAVEALLHRRLELAQAVLESGADDLIALHATLRPEQRALLSELVLEHGGSGGHGW